MKKTIFFLVACFACLFAVAQQRELPSYQEFFIKKKSSFSTFPKSFTLPQRSVQQNKLPDWVQPKFSHSLPNGNVVITLPQDNMPCVVPAMENYNMPVAKVGLDYDKQIHAVPPVLPKQKQENNSQLSPQ